MWLILTNNDIPCKSTSTVKETNETLGVEWFGSSVLFVWFSIIFALVLTEGTSKYVATYLEDKHFQCVSGDKNISSKTAVSLLLTNLKLSLEV